MNYPWLVIGALGTAAIAGTFARATKQYAIAAVAGGTVILYLHGWLYFHYTSDDAYISYRYARNLSDGLGLVWNPGVHVEGYSNFSWVVVLAGLHKLGANIVLTGRWLGFTLAAISGVLVYVLSTRILEGTPGRVAGLVAALLLSSAGAWAAWAPAGMETGLFATLILVAVLLHVEEQRGTRIPTSGVVWGFAVLTRPDGGVLLAVSGAAKLIEAVVRLRGSDPDRTRHAANEVLRLMVWSAGFAIVFAPYFAWRYQEYGWLFPNTYYAKVGSGLEQYDRGLHHFLSFAQEHAAWLLLLTPLAVAITNIRRGAALYVLALTVAWFAYIVYIGGDSLARYRMFAPVMPLLYVGIATSGAALVSTFSTFEHRAHPRIAEAALGVVVLGLMAFTLQASGTDFGLPPERDAVTDRLEMGRWLRDNVPPDSAIAVIPAGAMPYESRLVTIDMLGLNDEHIAHRDLTLGKLGAGHEKYDSQYVLDRQPDMIILADDLTPVPWARADYAPLYGGLIPARIDMLSQDRLWREYTPRSVQIREGKWFNLLVRLDASAVLAKTQAPETAAPR